MKETAGTTKGRNMFEAKIIDGKRFAERLRENIAAVVSDLKSGH
jgi:hypothetical protein